MNFVNSSSCSVTSISSRAAEKPFYRMLLLFFLLLIIFPSINTQPSSPFHCGSDSWNERLAEDCLERYCPEKIHTFDKCCKAHDDCYAEQLGRDYCDFKFCSCLQSARNHTAGCHVMAEGFCMLVALLGHLSYSESPVTYDSFSFFSVFKLS